MRFQLLAHFSRIRFDLDDVFTTAHYFCLGYIIH